jgi:hypothetical protein
MPSVTVALPPGGTTALVSVTAGVQGSSGSISCYMSFTVSGGTNTLVVMDSHALTLVSNQLQQASASFVITGLSGASATFYGAVPWLGRNVQLPEQIELGDTASRLRGGD